MKKPEFKLLPCVFCTIGFNCYVAGHRIISSTYQALSADKAPLEKLALSDEYKSV
ncbi:MAG: hypothetical protein ACI88A_002345 [Paraglaciecola sp.]|jgi:hypothetical protein